MGKMAQTLLEKLPYTPISAFGINFSYIEDIKKADLFNFFKFNDNDLLSQQQFLIKKSSLQRALIVEDRLLNLTLSSDGSEVQIDFNFHYDVASAKEAIEKMNNRIVENRQIAERILKDVYKLSLEATMGEVQ
jgi:hypothetical protein